ncbi:unnamed protein product [Alopecurus aequalis]
MSTSTIVARAKAKGHHVLKIHGYSHTKELVPIGEHVLSCGFLVGGRTWRIMYYPNGKAKEQADWISVGLNLEPDGTAAAVKACFCFSILDMNGEPVAAYTSTSYRIRTFPSPGRNDGWTFHSFVRRLDLEKSEHLTNDGFAIRCDVDVMSDVGLHLRVEQTFFDVPESDLHAHLARLLDTKEGADVEVNVCDETFSAHRCILAARSPAFKAELSSSTTGASIKIDGMGAPAFRALLRFIYTDVLPEMTEPAVARQLLAAADRYQVARLKLVCQDKLSRSLDKTKVDSAATAQLPGHHGRHRWLMMGCFFKFLNLLRPQRQPPKCSLHSTSVTSVDDKACNEATPSPSASVIVVSETTGHHVLKIEGYTRTKMMLANGQYFCPGEFQDNGVSADRFVTRSELESSRYLKDDCFTVRCDLTVFTKEVRAEPVVKVPPPVLPHHLCQLLSSQEGSDVSFKVGRETFVAHRCVLAARSSVFKAELLGPMREHKARCIHIDDMDAGVFRALLHFIYTDELPTTMKEEATTMAQHLLVAADRYDMERLKLVCEDKLGRHLDVGTAATTLALAEQHQCPQLKDAVLVFLCSSTANLRAVVESDGYEHLTASCPSITKELIVRLAAAL